MTRTAATQPAPRALSLPSGVTPLVVGGLATQVIWTQATSLPTDARMVLIVTVLAIIGWVAIRLPDSLVALLAALALVVTGAQPQEALTSTLGEPIVWLLLAAFVIAAVVKESGLAERLTAPLTASAPRVAPFFLLTALVISVTAFLLPSTSGRAALLLPVFLGLLPALPDRRLVKPLALLFPTAILLSAGGSLIGAGAHVVAVEAIAASGGPRLGYLDWLLIGAPLAAASVLAATLLILGLFVPRELWSARLLPTTSTGALTQVQSRVAIVLACLVALWIVQPLHGLNEAVVALAGADLLLFPPFCARKPKEVFRSVGVELVLFMAATLMLSVAVIDTGLDRWIADALLGGLPAGVVQNRIGVVLVLSTIAVAAHLLVTSRSARAAILIPAVALPVAGLGHDVTLAVLITVMGTGFCQTLMASAKPVAIFGLRDEGGFTQSDLIRLALPLAPIKVALLTGFALWVWPGQVTTTPAAKAPFAAVRSLTQEKRALFAAMPTVAVASTFAPLTPAQRTALSNSPDFNYDRAPRTSERPMAREDRASVTRSAPAPVKPAVTVRRATGPTTTATARPRQTVRVPNLPREVQRARNDLRAFGRQFERDLSRLLR